MAGSILDTSVLIDLATRPNRIVVEAIDAGDASLPPLVIAELITGASTPGARVAAGILIQEVQMHETSLDHWINVGLLRQHLRRHGLTITLPDAHIAQCALERDAILITRDAVFAKIAGHTNLRVITA